MACSESPIVQVKSVISASQYMGLQNGVDTSCSDIHWMIPGKYIYVLNFLQVPFGKFVDTLKVIQSNFKCIQARDGWN